MFNTAPILRLSAAIFLSGVISATAQSQSATPPPAELPPSDYRSAQYVDSRGCIYIRVGSGSTSNWLPRMTRDGKHFCGFNPTFSAEERASFQSPSQTQPAIEIEEPKKGTPIVSTTTTKPTNVEPPKATVSEPIRRPQNTSSQSAGSRYVQVGAFAVSRNAARALEQVSKQGFPVTSRDSNRGGRTLSYILAGPFSSSAELNAAKRQLQSAGFSDAFITK